MDNIKSAIYSNTLAMIRENGMLTEEKFIRLSDADFSDALKMLRDYGYGTSDVEDAGDFVTSGINSLIAFIREECHSSNLKSFILNQFYYGNAQLLYKSRFVDVNPKAFYEIGGMEELKNANEKRNYEDLPKNMREAFETLDLKAEQHPLTAREIDIVFTRAMNKDNLKNSAKCGRNIKRYYRKKIDLTNFITSLRCRRLNIPEETCREMLLEGGFTEIGFFSELIKLPEDGFNEAMKQTGYEKIIPAEDISDLSKAEERANDYLLGFTKAQIVDYTANEPFLRYFLLQMREFGLIKFLLISLKNGDRERLKGRLKELYDSVR